MIAGHVDHGEFDLDISADTATSPAHQMAPPLSAALTAAGITAERGVDCGTSAGTSAEHGDQAMIAALPSTPPPSTTYGHGDGLLRIGVLTTPGVFELIVGK